MSLGQPTVAPPPTLTASSEQRAAERFGAGLPYSLHGEQGHTLDLSTTGLSFESATHHPVGSVLELSLLYGLDGHNFPMQCKVEVVRVEPAGQRFTIAARFCRPFFDSGD
ncbi:MAG: hypothetical protein NVS3B2_09750 [Ramlibacter sp.]